MSYTGEGSGANDQRVWDGSKWVLAKRPLSQAQSLSADGSWDGIADYILVTGTGGRAITLPKPTIVPRNVTIIDAAGNSAANVIIVVAAGGGTIGGESSVRLNVDHAVIDLVFVSTAGAGSWSNISRNLLARRVRGRADGAGTGFEQDLTGAQLGSIVRAATFATDAASTGSVATYGLTEGQNAVKFNGAVGNATVHGATIPAEAGQVIFWHVDSTVTSNRVTFTQESASAGAAGQRFRTPSGLPLTLGAGDSAVSCYFDSRHHIIACSPQSGYQRVFSREVASSVSGSLIAYNPAGLSTCDRVMITLTADATLHGIVAPFVGFSFEVFITAGAFVLTVGNESATDGTAVNRIRCPRSANMTARLGDALRFTYISGSRWLVEATSSTNNDMPALTLRANATNAVAPGQDVSLGTDGFHVYRSGTTLVAGDPAGQGIGNVAGVLRTAAKVVTVNAVGGTQHDLALGTTDILHVTASTTITGFSGGYAGRHLYVMSYSNAVTTPETPPITVTLAGEQLASTVTNRITTHPTYTSLALGMGDGAHLLNNGVRWDVVAVNRSQTSNAELAQMASGTTKGMQIDGSTGTPVDLTGDEQGENIRFNTILVDSTSAGALTSYVVAVPNVAVAFTNVTVVLNSIVGVAGRFLFVRHTGTGSTTVTNQDAGSPAANRITTGSGGSLILTDGKQVLLAHHGGAWRIYGASAGPASLGTVTAGTQLGLQVDAAGDGVPVLLTGAEQGENIRFATEQYVILASPMAITLAADTSRIEIQTGGAAELQTITGGSDIGRIVWVYFSGDGSLLVKHMISLGGTARLSCPDAQDMTLTSRHSFVIVGMGLYWRVHASTAPPGRLIRVPQYLTSGTTIFHPNGTRLIKVRGCGGGGAGGGSSAAAGSGGANGGSAAYVEKTFTASSLTSTYTVGTAGVSVLSDNGGSGSPSTFTHGGLTVTASGGGGGDTLAGGTTVASAAGGPGGGGSNMDFEVRGQYGGYVLRPAAAATPMLHTAHGGGNPLGNGGRGVATSAGPPSVATSTGYGSGGSGRLNGTNTFAGLGGDGMPGVWIVEEYT